MRVRIYLVATIAAQVAIVILTVEDWDNRFLGPLIPYWLLLAALGAQPILKRWKSSLLGLRISSFQLDRQQTGTSCGHTTLCVNCGHNSSSHSAPIALVL
jgi:hypothetical protein